MYCSVSCTEAPFISVPDCIFRGRSYLSRGVFMQTRVAVMGIVVENHGFRGTAQCPAACSTVRSAIGRIGIPYRPQQHQHRVHRHGRAAGCDLGSGRQDSGNLDGSQRQDRLLQCDRSDGLRQSRSLTGWRSATPLAASRNTARSDRKARATRTGGLCRAERRMPCDREVYGTGVLRPRAHRNRQLSAATTAIYCGIRRIQSRNC